MNKFALIIVGLPGTGKTTISKKLSQLLPCYYCSSDLIRASIYNEQFIKTDRDYTIQELDVIYNKILDTAKLQAISGKNILVEGVFRNKITRDRLTEIFLNYGYTVFKYFIKCNDYIAIQRVENRKNNTTFSPAGKNGYWKIKEKFEFPLEAENFCTLENSKSSEDIAIIIYNEIKNFLK